MKGDTNIKQQIEKAIKSNTLLNRAEITVEVTDGNALLLGTVDRYPKKELARKIAKEVEGVKNSIEQIKVVIEKSEQCSDQEIKELIVERFIKNFGNSHSDITIIVDEGKVWLEGTLKWKYQKDLAQECILNIKGIRDIKNNISIPFIQKSAIDEKDILAAIYGDPSITTEIKIEIIGHRIVLKGKVHTIEQKNLVTRLVRNVPSVIEIENFLTIDRSF